MNKYKGLSVDDIIRTQENMINSQSTVIDNQAVEVCRLIDRIKLLEERIDHGVVYVDWIRESYKQELESKLDRQKNQYETKIKDILSEKEVKFEDLNKAPLP